MDKTSNDAERLIETRLAALETKLKAAGHSDEEIDIMIAGLQEHLLEDLSQEPSVDLASVEQRLADMIDEFDISAAAAKLPSEADGSLGKLALAVTLGVIACLVFGSLIGSALGADGGAIMILTALFGFPLSFVLGWMSRSSSAGRAALIITSLAVIGFAALMAVAFLGD